ncbi:cytochrome P450 [Exidia glandulosa HHB12029]|uniref:Cytochrome P450 n=1 Tax=Exidia glandulosa HHB12029 TaxID=1314781 RepID=A0A165LTQ7_EXIGL|nr:cytochrome P450 [Exidia glandulosa HHB12029]
MLVPLVLAAVVALLLWTRKARQTRLASLDGPPRKGFLAGHAADVIQSRVGTVFNIWAKKYGTAYRISYVFGKEIVVLGDPKAIHHVLTAAARTYERPMLDRIALEQWFGPSLFSASYDVHRRMRKTLNPAFARSTVEDVSGVVFDLAHKLVSSWASEVADGGTKRIELTHDLPRLTLDAIGMTTFRYNISHTNQAIFGTLEKMGNSPQPTAFDEIMAEVVAHFPILLRLPNEMKTWIATLRSELGRVADELVNGAVQTHGMHGTVLDALTAPDSRASREEIVAQIIGLLFAGHETSANVIAEGLYELAAHPEIQERLHDELVAAEQKVDHELNLADLENNDLLPFFDAVIREVIRCKAVLAFISRTAAADDVIPLQFSLSKTGEHAFKVQRGQEVMIPVRDGVNVDPRLWGDDAEEFRPERWLEKDEIPEEARLIQGWSNTLSFGDGPSACLGRTFAVAEIKIVISLVIRRFWLKPTGETLDFYRLGGNTIKSKIRGREADGVTLPLYLTLRDE